METSNAGKDTYTRRNFVATSVSALAASSLPYLVNGLAIERKQDEVLTIPPGN